MKKIYLFLTAISFSVLAHTQQPWQPKCDISSLHPYVNGGNSAMSYFDFNPNTQDEGFITRADSIKTTTNSGQTWSSAKSLPRNGVFGSEAAGYANNGNTIFAATWKQIHKSVDGGNTFTLVTDTLKYEPKCYAANGNFIAFGFTACAIAYSKDGGLTWTEKRIKSISSAVRGIHIISNNVVLVATASAAFYTKDGGATWTEFTPPAQTGTISSYFFTGTDENNWYISYTDGNQYLYKTTDGGGTWNNLITNWGGANLALRNLYATTNGTLFASLPFQTNRTARYKYSLDAGQTWILDSLDANTVAEVRGFRQIGNTMYALSEQITTPVIRKIYALNLGGTTTAINDIEANPLQISLFPNPSTTILNIESAEEIQIIQVSDIAGRIVIAQINLATPNTQLPTVELPTGSYFIHIKTISGKSTVKRFVKQ
jgi:photosystem II stability/assembly factor-like uncharacterized protein